MKVLKKILTCVLILSMSMGVMSVTAFADEAAIPESLYVCGIEAHEHGELCACGATQDEICGKEIHTHDGCSADGCAIQYDIACNTEEHVHSADKGCFDEGTEEVICTVTVHTHTEEGGCYTAHSHVDNCYDCGKAAHESHVEGCYKTHVCNDACYTCGMAAHKHVLGCVSEENQQIVNETIEALNGVPALAEMQAARKGAYAQANFESADAAESAYETYIAECFAAREAAVAAYYALPAELQALIPADAADLDELDTVFNRNNAASVSKDTDGYNFQAVFPRNRSYELGTHLNDGGHPMTVIMVDSDDVSGSWAPSDRYVFGVSDYEVLYCCEIKQPVKDGTHYKRVNLEDADYYDDDAAAHIRAIVTHSYPYVSLEQMKSDLKDSGYPYADELTRGDVISAVQFAIWHYSNANYAYVDGMSSYGSSIDINNVSYASAYHDYSNEMWHWWNTGRNATFEDADAETRVNALVDYLTGLEKSYAEENEIVISSVEIKGMEPVQEKDGVYNVVVKVVLNNGGINADDDVKITVSSKNAEGAVTGTTVAAVTQGVSEYDLVVEAKYGETIEVSVEGVQNLPESVYLYEPKGGKEVSQVMVGVASGLTVVSAHESVALDVPEGDPVTADMKMQKTDAYGNVLTGAEFDLMVTADNMTYKIGSYTLDGNGQLAVENLLPGDYQLIETKAPEGFQLLTVPVEFTVSEEGEVALVSNAGNMAYISGDVLNVRNNPVVTPYYPPYEEETPEPPADTPEEPPLVEVEDPEIPLEDVEVEDPDVPLAEMEEIEEEEVPLTDVPKTSDSANMMIWMMMALLSAAALVGIRFAERRER